MARGQAQYLRVFDDGGSYERWQNYYIGVPVTYAGKNWAYVDFDAEGFTAGQTGDEGGVTVTFAATAAAMSLVIESLRQARLVELSMYEFDTLIDDTAPQEDQVLIAGYIGEVVAASGRLESVTIELGSSLSPVGAQIPPRKFTSRLIGVPCKL